MSAGHEFVSVDKALKGKMKASVVYCKDHPPLEINTYCHTDKQAICLECHFDFHKGHEVERLINVVKGFKEKISVLANKVSCLFSFLLSFFFPSSPSSIIFDSMNDYTRSKNMTMNCSR